MKKENRFRVPRVCCAAVLVAALNVLAVSAAEVKIDPKTLDAYVGQYELQEARFVFRRQGDALLCQVAKEGVFHMEAKSDKRFVLRELPDMGFTFKQDAKGKTTSVMFHKAGEDFEIPKTSDQAPQGRMPELNKIPRREPKAGPNLVDLSGKYNSRLDEFWQPDGAPEVLQQNHLGAMPRGVQRLGTVDFDVRGVVQLGSSRTAAEGGDLPKQVNEIRVNQKCRRIHFLHGTQWRVADGTRIGSYVLHYAGGTRAEVPVIYGQHLRDWWTSGTEEYNAKIARVAWKGSNKVADSQKTSLRIFESTHQNPHPEQLVQSVDFVSAMTDSAPFLIAITLE
ncbi:MAG TPA: hypothetical protein VJA21_27490 [Verrucomicrobiae bacterium]